MKRLFTFILFFAMQFSWAQQAVEKDSFNMPGIVEKLFDTADRMVDRFSGKSWIFIPALTYSPETSLGIGARAIKVFKPKEDINGRPSTIPITLLYTLNEQVIFTSALDLWMNGNADHLYARLELSDYPFKFYGIGDDPGAKSEEDYASRSVQVQFSYQKRLASALYLGPQYKFTAADIYRKEVGGLLDSGRLLGSNGQRTSGIGLVVNFDTRDNIFQPGRGSFHQASFMSFRSFLGSEFTFSQYQLDLRKYKTIYDRQVLAVQAWYSVTTGNAPFQQLSLLGGSDLMRGYFEGRYRDRNAMVYQAEYRVPVYRKLGLVVFGSAGQVAAKLSTFSFNRLRYGGGLGFRYQLTEDGLNLRLDLAYGNQRAFYFGLNEVL